MIASISPIVTIVLAVGILGEKFELIDAIGSAMVILGWSILSIALRRFRVQSTPGVDLSTRLYRSSGAP